MSLLQRLKNIWFLSGISKEDIQANPHAFATIHANRIEMKGKAYIVGLSEEEQSFADSLSKTKDTKLS